MRGFSLYLNLYLNMTQAHTDTHRHTQTHTDTQTHRDTHTHTNTSGLTTHGQNIYERVQLKFVLAEKAPDHSPGLQTIAKNFANRAKPRGEKSSQKRPKLRHTRMVDFGWGAPISTCIAPTPKIQNVPKT